jgi:hypothetical protein
LMEHPRAGPEKRRPPGSGSRALPRSGETSEDERGEKEDEMRASVNDRLVVRSHHVGDSDRVAVVLEVRGRNGEPPYLVRWSDGHESVFFPSSDTVVEHHPG